MRDSTFSGDSDIAREVRIHGSAFISASYVMARQRYGNVVALHSKSNDWFGECTSTHLATIYNRVSFIRHLRRGYIDSAFAQQADCHPPFPHL
uniref:Uncharacterized protein n=1 Tax=Kalanchoe fedtschenkoi TaxID=63787 RepID=A0A7N0RI88_KALFE